MKRHWSAFFVCLLVSTAFAEKPFSLATTPGLLPKSVVPHKYEVLLKPATDLRSFSGKVTIELEVREPVNRIVMNAKGLKITNALFGAKAETPLKPEFDEAQETVAFQLPHEITPGKYSFHVTFSGAIGTAPCGLYRVDYSESGKPASMLVTQMEPADARGVFPCWDEPVFRSVFELKVVIPENFVAVSNMPVSLETKTPDAKLVEFEPTPSMSSYLIAFVAGRLEKIEGKADGIPVHVYTTIGQSRQGRVALEALEKILSYYHDYFGMLYPLPKLDLVAIPDKTGAMENWGAIFFGENVLLYDAGKSSEYTRQVIFEIVAHEMAHQWFGNLVTMAWWDNLWLNEGFASWMATKTTDHFNPAWQCWARSNADKEWAMWLDAKRTTHPIQQPVKTVGEALDMFDGISYQKGQAFIRMLEAFLGAEKFRAGLRDYMKAHAYSNTTTADLWAALGKASGQNVEKIAGMWTEQPGFPVVMLNATDKDGKERIELTQERFTTGESVQPPLQWTIPFTFLQEGIVNNFLTRSTGSESLSNDAKGVFKGNAGDTGYYRVSYDSTLTKRLLEHVGDLSAADRVNHLSDTWAMFISGRASLLPYLQLAKALKDDPSLPVAQQITWTLDHIEYLLRENSMRADFRKQAIAIVRPQYKRLGWEQKPDEPPTDTLLRTDVIGALAKWGDAEVIDEAKKRFTKFLTNPASLPGNLRYPVFRIVGREADQKEYDTLRKLAAAANGTEESRVLYSAVACARDAKLAEQTLELAKGDSVPPGTAIRLIRWVEADGEHADMAWKFADANCDLIQGKLGSLWGNDYFPEMAGSLTALDADEQLRAFAKKHLGPETNAAVERSIEDMHIDRKTREQLIEQLAEALKATR